MRLLPELAGQVAVVTGAGRGIGRAVAMALAECGAHVVLAARSTDQLQHVKGEIGAAATVCETDVAVEGQVERLFAAVDALGRGLHILVNNAGVGVFGPAVGFGAGDFDRVMAVNVRGTFLCARAALQRMTAARRGTIVNVSSVVGLKGYPNQAAYTASKHAVMGLTKSLAVEAQAAGVRVSVVCPGGVDTELVGDARPDLDRAALMTPQDVAQTVLYLLSLSERAAVDQVYIRRRGSAPF